MNLERSCIKILELNLAETKIVLKIKIKNNKDLTIQIFH